jgi:hypothetical protein
MSRYLNIFEAVKYDVRLHGARFIIVEFAAAVLIALALMSVKLVQIPNSLSSLMTALWFAGVALNGIAVILLAWHTSRTGLEPGFVLRRVQLYTVELIVLLLIPCAVALATLLQWRSGDLRVGRTTEDMERALL